MKFQSLIAAALMFMAANSQAALIHQFDLNGNLKDAKGGKDLATFQGGILGPTGFSFSGNKGLKLEDKLGGEYSIDMSFKLDLFLNYSRILNFKGGSGDAGFYAAGNAFYLYPANVGVGGNLEAGKYSHVTVTRDADKNFKVYQEGKLVYNYLDTAGITDFELNDAIFFRDDGGDAPTGAVDYINIYNHSLSQAEVNSLNGIANLPEPASMGLVGAGLALLGWTRRRKPQAAA